MKKCKECHKEKNFIEFNNSSSTKDGYQFWCRDCQKIKYNEYRLSHKDSINKKWKRYYKKHKKKMIERTRIYEDKLGSDEYIKRWKRYNKNCKFKNYGITEEEYNQFLDTQKQKCGMCFKLFDKKNPRSIHIDHSHKTGKVRGILCDGCNLFLGRFESDTYQAKIEQAQTYLRKTEK